MKMDDFYEYLQLHGFMPEDSSRCSNLSQAENTQYSSAAQIPIITPDMDWSNPNLITNSLIPELSPTFSTTTTTGVPSLAPPTVHAHSSGAEPKEVKSEAQLLSEEHRRERARLRKLIRKESTTVHEVDGETEFKDCWSWKKYGQKPLKNSPFPRSYHKCSSSETCFALKQVDQISENPEKYIVRYSGNHTHPPPGHIDKPLLTTCPKPGFKLKKMVTPSSDVSYWKNTTTSLAPGSSSSGSSGGGDYGEVLIDEMLVDDDDQGDDDVGYLDDEELFEGVDDLLEKFFRTD